MKANYFYQLVIGCLVICTACATPDTSIQRNCNAKSNPAPEAEKKAGDLGNNAMEKTNKFMPFIQIIPTEATVKTGGTVQFSATINYDPNGPQYIRQPVAFSVAEPDGGNIDMDGNYKAASNPGTYHVIAKREDFPGVEAKANVIVAK